MTNSVLYNGTLEKLISDFKKGTFSSEFSNYGCCAFLSRSSNPYVGVIPTNYVATNKDVSEDFEKWIDFLKRNLKVEINYFMKEMPFSGAYSANAANKILETIPEDKLKDPKVKVKPFSFMADRDKINKFTVKPDKVLCNGYLSRIKESIKFSNLTGSPTGESISIRRTTPGGNYKYDSISIVEHLSKPSKVYFVEIPKPKKPQYNPFRLLIWTFARDFYSNYTLIKLLLEKEDLIKEYISSDIGWLLLYSFLRDQVGGSYFLYNIQKFPYDYSDLERIADEIVETFDINTELFGQEQFMMYSYLGMYSLQGEVDKVKNWFPEYGGSGKKIGYASERFSIAYGDPLMQRLLNSLYNLDTRSIVRRIKEHNTSYVLTDELCNTIFKALDILKQLTTKHGI